MLFGANINGELSFLANIKPKRTVRFESSSQKPFLVFYYLKKKVNNSGLELLENSTQFLENRMIPVSP